MNKNFFPKKISLIYGNQELLIKETYESLIDQILTDRQNDFCVEKFDLEKNGK